MKWEIKISKLHHKASYRYCCKKGSYDSVSTFSIIAALPNPLLLTPAVDFRYNFLGE